MGCQPDSPLKSQEILLTVCCIWDSQVTYFAKFTCLTFWKKFTFKFYYAVYFTFTWLILLRSTTNLTWVKLLDTNLTEWIWKHVFFFFCLKHTRHRHSPIGCVLKWKLLFVQRFYCSNVFFYAYRATCRSIK